MAYVLDLLVGDPAWLPHPVRMIGSLISRLESALYTDRSGRQQRIRGILLTGVVCALTSLITLGLVRGAVILGPVFAFLVSVWLVSSTIAPRGLHLAANKVLVSLHRGELEEARRNLSLIVGRDTCRLSEAEVLKAVIETVSENTVDAVVSPLFFALAGGGACSDALQGSEYHGLDDRP